MRDLRAALAKFNPELPEAAIDEAVAKLTHHDYSRSLLQHNQAFYKLIRDGVPVSYRDAQGPSAARAGPGDRFPQWPGHNNRFLVVRELKITGLRTPNYNRRADLVCFVNGLPLVFIELKAVYKNIRAGFDGNLRDYLDENVIAHAFHHNAFLIVSNGDNARYGSITSAWEHFGEWKRLDEHDKGSVEAEVLLNGMLAKDRLLDIVENFILFDASKTGRSAQGGGAQPSVAGGESGGGGGGAAGGAEASVSAGRAAEASRGRTASAESSARRTSRWRLTLAASQRLAGQMAAPSRSREACRLSSARTPISGGWAWSGTRRAAASRIRWPSLPRRCGARCRAISPLC